MYRVGRAYDEGWGGVSKSRSTAISWFRKAARRNFGIAKKKLKGMGQSW
jgi:TPR repeat protein